MENQIKISDLIESTDRVLIGTSLGVVNRRFKDSGQSYVGVVDDKQFRGLFSCLEMRSKMSNQFGFEIFSRELVENHLLDHCTCIQENCSIEEALEAVFSRTEGIYHDDVVVIDCRFEFVGLIPVYRLARIQQSLLEDKIRRVERHEKELSEKNLQLHQIADQLNALNTQLEQTRDEALESTRLKSEFLANMSHEIRTPMNGVLGMVDLLKDTKLTEEQQFFTDTIHHSAETLITIINDILDFSKIEADRIDLIHEDFILVDLVDSCMQQVISRCANKPIRLIIDMPFDLECCYIGDSVRLQQVLVNLLGNAVKFTEMGEIILRIRKGENSIFSPKQTTLHFTVEDSGVGIRKKDLSKLFDPFVQVDGSSKRRQDGSGLGLSICHRLSTLMKGELRVESEFGKGSRFHFSVPIPVSQRTVEQTRINPNSSWSIHLLSNNDSISRLFQEACIQQGIQCRVTHSIHAFDDVGSGDFLVLDAFEFSALKIDELKCWIREQDFPISNILVITKIKDGFRRELESIGIRRFLYYPFRMDVLFNQLDLRNLEEPIPVSDHFSPFPERENQSLKILLVEDHLTNRKLATILLDKLGHAVESAENGRIAIEKLKNQPFDCILMDCMMPEMDGFECTRAIRSGREGVPSDIYIIAVTAKAMKGDREKCLKIGMDDYVSKPLTRLSLTEALHRCSLQLCQI